MKFPTALNHSNVNALLEETTYVVNWPHFSWMKLVKLSDHFVSFQLSTVQSGPCTHKQSHNLQCFFLGKILHLGDQKKVSVTHTKGFYEKKWPKVARFQGYQISRKLFAGVKLALLEYLPESCSAGLPTAQNLEGTSTNSRSLSETYKCQRSDAVIFVGGKIFLFFEILFGRWTWKNCVFSVWIFFSPSKKLPLSRNKEEEES